MSPLLRCLLPVLLLGPGLRAAEHEILKSFALPPGGALVVDSYRGDIVIEEGDLAQANLALHFDYDVDTNEEAEKLWAGVQLQLRPEPGRVFVGIRNPIETGPRLSWQEKKRIAPHVRVVVPRHCDLNLTTRNGNITVGQLSGRMTAQVEHGTIFFRQVDGSVTAQAEDGDIVISRCSGDIRARALRGSVRVGLISGKGNLKSANGGVEVMLAKGGLVAEAEAGDVSVGFGRAITAPATISSAGGNVRVALPPEASCEVEASASWGRIDNAIELTAATSKNGRHLSGRLNAGGPTVKVHAAGGSVRLEPADNDLE